MNRLKSLALLTVLATASVFSFAQNANAWVIFPSSQPDYYQYDHHHDSDWNRFHEREWRERHERELRERREYEWRQNHPNQFRHY